MHIVIVRDRLNAKLGFGAKEDFVSDGAAEGTDTSAAQIVEGTKARRVGIADAQHFVELVIRNGGRHSGAPRRRVFNPTQADLGIAALDGLRSEEHTSELQSLTNLVCRLLLEKKKHN